MAQIAFRGCVAAIAAIASTHFQPAAAREYPRLVERCGGTFALCGFADRNTGAIAIEPRFDLAGRFSHGLAEVLLDGQTGVIDRSGRIVVEPRFARSVPLTSEVLLVREGRWRTIHFAGHERLDSLGDIPLLHEPDWRLLNVASGYVPMPAGARLEVFDNSGRGYIWANVGQGRGKLYGLLRADGTWQIEPQFTAASKRYDTYAVVHKSEGGRELSGAVDVEGRLAFPMTPHKFTQWVGNFGMVRTPGKSGFIDKRGNLIGGRWFDKVEGAHMYGISRVWLDGRWIAIDADGNFLPEDAVVLIEASCPSGVKVARKANGLVIIGPDGRETTKKLLDFVDHFPFRCDRPNPVLMGMSLTPEARWGFMDPNTGHLIDESLPFEAVSRFEDGHAIVKQGGKYGIISTSGAFTVRPQFDLLHPWGTSPAVSGTGLLTEIPHSPEDRHHGIYAASTGQRPNATITAVAADGTVQPRIEQPSPKDRALACSGGSKIFRENGRWGLKDLDGKVIIQPNYRALHCFSAGVAWAPIDAERMWCPIDPDGSVRSAPDCASSRYPYIQTHSHPEQFSNDAYENSVLWSAALLEYGIGHRPAPPRMVGDGGNGGMSSIIRR